MPARISQHISYSEATKSQTATRLGIDNAPDAEALEAMQHVASTIFEPVRAHFGGRPIAITSFYRSPALNHAIGGSATSQHCRGEAIDIDADVFDGPTNRAIFEYIRTQLAFDQLIWEFGTDENPAWVHVSAKVQGNRGQVLRAIKADGFTRYEAI